MDQKKPRHQGGAFVVNRNGCLIVFGRSAGSPVVWAGCLSVLSAADGGMGARGTAVLSTGDGGRHVMHKAQ